MLTAVSVLMEPHAIRAVEWTHTWFLCHCATEKSAWENLHRPWDYKLAFSLIVSLPVVLSLSLSLNTFRHCSRKMQAFSFISVSPLQQLVLPNRAAVKNTKFVQCLGIKYVKLYFIFYLYPAAASLKHPVRQSTCAALLHSHVICPTLHHLSNTSLWFYGLFMRQWPAPLLLCRYLTCRFNSSLQLKILYLPLSLPSLFLCAYSKCLLPRGMRSELRRQTVTILVLCKYIFQCELADWTTKRKQIL